MGLEFLKTSKIPYARVRIGPVVRKDVMRASTMLEHEEKYACILAFDVKVERDAQEMADREGGTVKTAAQKKKEKKAKQLQKLKEEKEKERKGGKPQAQEEKSEAVKEAEEGGC